MSFVAHAYEALSIMAQLLPDKTTQWILEERDQRAERAWTYCAGPTRFAATQPPLSPSDLPLGKERESCPGQSQGCALIVWTLDA
jgi:hypothetical protein